MLLDTDVLIWNFRGNEKAANLLDNNPGFTISAVTYMEVLQGVKNGQEMKRIRRTLRQLKVSIEAIDAEISSRAVFLVEKYALSHNMQLSDALIASTAIATGETLITGNDKHYRFIEDLDIQVFRPS
jgi:hypothetical protein